MEVDCIDSNNCNPSDLGKFSNLKAFVTAARQFKSTHSENSSNLMTRYLGLIASSCDLTIFSPGRPEVCELFSSLWRVMCDERGPHWAGVAVLARASLDPNARHALTHTYKFMPILARLLTDSISTEKKIKLLTVMQDISHGIKISWQESYLSELMKQLTDWITQAMAEPAHRTIGHKSLTVLVNICYGNLPAIYALMRTVDTKEFVAHLIGLKDNDYGGVEVCRLLLCLSGASRGVGAIKQTDVHSYLCCTMRTFIKAMSERDETQLLHAYTFLNDLCTDTNLNGYVMTYSNFTLGLDEGLKIAQELSNSAVDETSEPENTTNCLRNVLKFLTVLVNLNLYSLRGHHSGLVAVCLSSSRVCLPESLELFAAVVNQYKDEGRLPSEVISALSEGLPALLVPPALEPGKAGLQWLQVVGALCESSEIQERVLREVTPDAFEDTLQSVLLYTAQSGAMGTECAISSCVIACRAALLLASVSREWERTLHSLLNHNQVRKMLCAGLTSNDGSRRRQILQLVKHHYFPSDQMNAVFGETLPAAESPAQRVSPGALAEWSLAPAQERAVDALVQRLAHALQHNLISDIATSSVMELYGYKISCLEQRLHSHSVALQGASEHMASLQHALAMTQASNSAQQDVLYTTQMHNEKHKSNIEDLHRQLGDAETTLRGFRAKLAAERLDKEHLMKDFKKQLADIEDQMQIREKEAEERVKRAAAETEALHKKLEQQTNKNTELAGVLVKFEERVQQRDKRLEDAANHERALKKDIEQREMTIKQLEKTVAERENRLYQVTSQLDEMKRVQEMVAKLMSKSTAAGGS